MGAKSTMYVKTLVWGEKADREIPLKQATSIENAGKLRDTWLEVVSLLDSLKGEMDVELALDQYMGRAGPLSLPRRKMPKPRSKPFEGLIEYRYASSGYSIYEEILQKIYQEFAGAIISSSDLGPFFMRNNMVNGEQGSMSMATTYMRYLVDKHPKQYVEEVVRKTRPLQVRLKKKFQVQPPEKAVGGR